MERIRQQAEILTPQELLFNAETLFKTNDRDYFRPAILEAITALEVYVQNTLFPALNFMTDKKIVDILNKKTQMDFDTRIADLIPLVTGINIERNSTLWKNLKEARNIRNKITHKGKNATKENARFVLDTVNEWLEYLGSNIKIENSILRLKNEIEKKNIKIDNEKIATKIITNYFDKIKATITTQNKEKNKISTDIQIRIGNLITTIEIKYFPHQIDELIVEKLFNLEDMYRKEFSIYNLIILCFHKEPLPKEINEVIRKNVKENGYIQNKISVIFVKS